MARHVFVDNSNIFGIAQSRESWEHWRSIRLYYKNLFKLVIPPVPSDQPSSAAWAAASSTSWRWPMPATRSSPATRRWSASWRPWTQYRRRIRAARRALERQQDQPVQAAVHADRCLKLLAETVTKMRDVITDFAAGVATGVVKR
jgi:hypothetical protein